MKMMVEVAVDMVALLVCFIHRGSYMLLGCCHREG